MYQASVCAPSVQIKPTVSVLSDIDNFPICFIDIETGEVNRNQARVLEIIAAAPGVFQKKFGAWLSENWHIWLSFDEEADRAYKAGHDHYSARTIIEYLRHNTNLRESSVTAAPRPNGDRFKINNSYVPDLGRLYGMVYPTRAEFFECRDFKGVALRTAIRGEAGAFDPHMFEFATR